MKMVFNHLLKGFALIFLCFATTAEGKGAKGYDICNLDAIYTSAYSYSLPKGILQSYLSGRGFDYPKKYTSKESAKLNADINELYRTIMDSNPVREKVAVLTAGAPGAGKTTVMRQKMQAAAKEGLTFSYICPDDVCLKSQARTYVADVRASNGSFEAREAAYTKWRPASNAAAHILLANLIKDKYAFYFGTTCSSPMTYSLFEFLKGQGYRIKVLHVSAPDDVRWKSIQKRDTSFVQTTEEDTREKGKMVPQRILDTFLKYADQIEFYVRSAVDANAVHAATWAREKGLTVLDTDAYEEVKAVHNAAIRALEMPKLLWENTMEAERELI